MSTLIVAVVSLLLWGSLAFVVGVPSGMVHALLALGAVLLVRWWALRA